MEIHEMTARVGTANATVKKLSEIEVDAGDDRRTFIYLVRSVLPPGVAVAINLELRDMDA